MAGRVATAEEVGTQGGPYEFTEPLQRTLRAAFGGRSGRSGRPDLEQRRRVSGIRDGFAALAEHLATHCPPSPELAAALNRLQESHFWAREAIYRNE